MVFDKTKVAFTLRCLPKLGIKSDFQSADMGLLFYCFIVTFFGKFTDDIFFSA